MIFAHLTRHWMARRREYSLASWLLSITRSLRVLVCYRDHRALCQLGVYRNHVAAPSNDASWRTDSRMACWCSAERCEWNHPRPRRPATRGTLRSALRNDPRPSLLLFVRVIRV